MERIGLIAGAGKLPEAFVKGAQDKGREVLVVGVEGITEVPAHRKVPFGKVGKLLKVLEEEGVRELVMLGKFEHKLIFSDFFSFDFTALNLLRRLKDRRPESLIRAFMNFLEEKGFTFIDPTPFLEDLLAEEGPMTEVRPSPEVLADGRLGFKVAKELASLDVGQTVVVKEGAVVAVEAMEGTQETIERGARIGGKGFSVVKVARRRQDMRIDVPAVGEETLEVVKRGGGKALFLEAGKVFIVDKENFLKKAQKYRVAVFGLKDG
ncbi:MAG: LpxI family protein [Aquificae bacterium]|nr:LpxI family protein [Aquificota bacterium]